MKKFLFAIAFVIIGLALISLGIKAQSGGPNLQTQMSATSATTGAGLAASGIGYHQIQWTLTGPAPTACTITVDSSPDNSTWTTGGIISAQTCTTGGISSKVSVVANYIRINLSTFTSNGQIFISYNGWNSTSTSLVNGAGSNPLGASLNVKAFPYSAVGNTQQVINVSTIAAGSSGCPAGAFNGLCFDIPSAANAPFLSTDVGLTFYANYNGGSMLLPATIASVSAGTGAHTGEQMIATASPVTNTGGCGGVCTVAWGTDDTIAIQKAFGSAVTLGKGNNSTANCFSTDISNWSGQCPRVYFPPGGYMTSGGGTTTSGGPGRPGAQGDGTVGISIVGSGMNATAFFLRPDYSIGALATNLGFFINNPYDIVGDFQITSSGFTFSFVNNPPTLFNAPQTTVYRVRLTDIGNSSGAGLLSIGGGHDTVENIISEDPSVANGSPLCDFNGGLIDVYSLFCSNNNSATVPNLQIRNYTGGTSGSRLTIHGGFIDECGANSSNFCTTVTASKDIGFFGTVLTSGATGSTSLSVDGTSEVRCSGCTLAPFSTGAGSGVTVASGGRFSATMTKFIANGVGNFIWNCATITACIDDGGNIYTLNNSATLYAAGTSPVLFPLATNATTQLGGQQVVSGTAPTFAVTGFGGAPTVTVQTGSTDAVGAVTVTAGTTPSSSGTFTLTFSRNLGTNAPVCTFNLVNGTGSWNALAQEPVVQTPAIGSVLANWADNSVALINGSTYGFNWECYGK